MRRQIPFSPAWKEKMLQGQKCCTARTRKYGAVGDTFEAYSHLFEITNIDYLPLEQVALQLFQKEGVSSPEEYQEVWQQLHPYKGFVPHQLVFVHHFKLIGNWRAM